MSSWNAIYLVSLLVVLLPIKVNCDKFCGNQTLFLEPKGIIGTTLERSHGIISNCSWTIDTLKNSVVFINVDFLQLGSYEQDFGDEENCLHITSIDKKVEYLKLCSDVIYYNTVSVPTNSFQISLEITSESYVILRYSSYIVNCPDNELKCLNRRLYFTEYDKVCIEGMLICNNLCKYGAVMCGNVCYNFEKDRCNGVLDCPTAEDELGCNPNECPNQIRCSNDSECFGSTQFCDKKIDCKNGFDEYHCTKFFCLKNQSNCNIQSAKESDVDTDEYTYIIPTVFAVMIIFFVYLLCKCMSNRTAVRNLMDHPIEVPLPPFTGPEESSTSVEDFIYSNNDFRLDNDIYENLRTNMEKIKTKRNTTLKNDITVVRPAERHIILDKYIDEIKPILSEEMAALASIKITREMCHGLRKSKSEERHITRRLFIDNFDEESRDSCSGEASNGRKNKVLSKSDTYFEKQTEMRINSSVV